MAMATLAFDTHKAVKTLTEAGAAEPLAEAMVATIGVAMGENIATKADVADLGKELRQEMANLGKDLRKDMQVLEKKLEASILRMTIALGVLVMTVLGGLYTLSRML